MKKHFLFTAVLFAALSFGFVSCENPDDDKFGNSIEQSDDDKFGNSTKPSDDNETPDSGDDDTDSPISCFTPAAFSVSSSKQVYFSKGNLQYTQSTNTWSFASAQWEIIGTDNVTGGSVSSDPTYGDSKECTALADRVDLFGWSTSTTNFGVSTSAGYDDDYNYGYGSFVNWGRNQIGADAPNTWRTLTADEWDYVVFYRPNASSLNGVAQVNGVTGLILLPDSWTCPEGITFKSGFHSERGVDYYAAYQTFTADQWQQMEAAGAVFLPAAGSRYRYVLSSVQNFGGYWSATLFYSDDYANCFYFHSDAADVSHSGRYYGYSVRLVKYL